MKTIRENKLWVAMGIVAVLLVGLSALTQSAKADGGGQISFNASLNEVSAFLCSLGVTECPADEPEIVIGALAGPDLPFNYIGVGGLREHRFGATFSATTTSVCVFAPDFGTTTVRGFSVGINTSTSTATVITIAKSDNNTGASTTVLWETSLGANTKGFLDVVSTSTGDGIDELFTLGPNDTLNISIEGAVVGTPTGLGDYLNNTCSASFIVH